MLGALSGCRISLPNRCGRTRSARPRPRRRPELTRSGLQRRFSQRPLKRASAATRAAGRAWRRRRFPCVHCLRVPVMRICFEARSLRNAGGDMRRIYAAANWARAGVPPQKIDDVLPFRNKSPDQSDRQAPNPSNYLRPTFCAGQTLVGNKNRRVAGRDCSPFALPGVLSSVSTA